MTSILSRVLGSAGGWLAQHAAAREAFHTGVRTPAHGPDEARSLPDVWSAVSLLADTVATAPIRCYRRPDPSAPSTPLEALPRWADPDDTPNPRATQTETLFHAMASLAMRGNGYIRILELGPDAYPASVEVLHPDQVRPDRRNGTDVAVVSSGTGTETLTRWTPRRRDGEYVHVRWWADGSPCSPSPIEVHARTLLTQLSQRQYLRRIWDPGPTGAGLLTGKIADIPPEDIKRLNAWLAERATAPDVAGAPLLVPGELSWVPLTLSPADADLLNVLKLGTLDIGRIYKIPPHLLAAYDTSTWGAGIKAMNLFFQTITLRPWTRRLSEALSHILPPRTYAALDLDYLTDGTFADRVNTWAKGIQTGQVTRNETRAKEDRPPYPGGDVPLHATNLTDGRTPE